MQEEVVVTSSAVPAGPTDCSLEPRCPISSGAGFTPSVSGAVRSHVRSRPRLASSLQADNELSMRHSKVDTRMLLASSLMFSFWAQLMSTLGLSI